MRRLVALPLLAAIACGAAAAASPRLRIVDRSPLALSGSGFGARERVSVTVSVGGKGDHAALRATGKGTFLVRFPALVYDRCHGALKVVAVGARGHRAGFSLQPLPCPNSQDAPDTG
ncbi:MAG: hypothetical protein ACXVZN_06615 [Gaiellaceae bacterium]